MPRPDVLREAFDYRFSSLDPAAPHIDPPSVAIYEPLLAKGPDWRAHGLLATDWTTSSDGLEWRFTLHPQLRFHSGAPCDAPAVVAAYEFLRWGLTPNDQLWYWDPVDTVEAVGDGALRVRLRHPYARLPSLLWGTHTAVHNESLRARDPDRFGRSVADGTGPYRLVSWSEDRVVAERWDAYVSPIPAFLDAPGRRPGRIEWLAILDPSDRLRALEEGDVDIIHGPPLAEVERLLNEDRFDVVEFAQQSNVYLAVDFRRSDVCFDDRRLRQALSLAIDRGSLVREILHGHGAPSFGAIPPGDEHYDARIDDAGAYDPRRAAQILDSLGLAAGSGGARGLDGQRLAVRCLCQEDAVLRPLAEAVRDQLARIGVGLELEFVPPFAPYYDAVAARPPALMSKWLWPDPVDALIGFTSTRAVGLDNWQGSSIPVLDRAFADWLRAGTDELAAAASHVQETVAHELPYIPLVAPNDVWVHRRAVAGYSPYQANLYPFYQPVRLTEPSE